MRTFFVLLLFIASSGLHASSNLGMDASNSANCKIGLSDLKADQAPGQNIFWFMKLLNSYLPKELSVTVDKDIDMEGPALSRLRSPRVKIEIHNPDKVSEENFAKTRISVEISIEGAEPSFTRTLVFDAAGLLAAKNFDRNNHDPMRDTMTSSYTRHYFAEDGTLTKDFLAIEVQKRIDPSKSSDLLLLVQAEPVKLKITYVRSVAKDASGSEFRQVESIELGSIPWPQSL